MKVACCSLMGLVLSMMATGLAQPVEDHQKCYWVNDPLAFSDQGESWLELNGSRFGLENCRIIGRGVRLFCVPVTKTITGEVDVRSGNEPFQPLEVVPVSGDPVAEQVCYQIQCDENFPEPPNPSQEVTDQFGTRTFEKLKPYLLCGPVEEQGPGPDGCTTDADCTLCQVCDAGECVSAAAGTDPREDCVDEGAASCGQNGECDGQGSCELYAENTVCEEASCTSSAALPQSLCDGAGNCVPGDPVDCDDGQPCTENICSQGACSNPPSAQGSPGEPSCEPYACDGASPACPSSCTDDADCAFGNICVGSACVPDEECVPGDQQSCDVGPCTGLQVCQGGQWGECVLPAEVCDDGLDNDCDAQFDEGCACIVGAQQACGTVEGECSPGAQTCVGSAGEWGPCEGFTGPSEETCDGLDNDCDGLVDEDTGTGVCGVGECAREVPLCAGGVPTNCVPGEPEPEVCADGLDNDCDGVVDNGCSSSSCQTDGDCQSGYYCSSGNQCEMRQSNGTACLSGNQCQSANCVDGYCCETSCNSDCDRCNLSGRLGSCTPSPAGSPGDPSCSPYVCNGTSTACPSSCVEDSDCGSGFSCSGGQCSI